MKPWLVVLAICLFGCVLWGAEETWAPSPSSDQPVAVAVVDAGQAPEVAADGAAADRLTLKQRRALGLTIPAITKAYKSVKQAGIDPAASKSEIAAAVLEKLATDNPKAYAGDTLDWEAILAFIERIIDLIMRLFPAT